MGTRRFVVSFVVLLAVGALFASVALAADVFTGTWKVNIEKSTFSPGPAPKGPNTVQVKVIDNGMNVVLNNVGASGRKNHTEYTVKFDGKDYPTVATVDGKPNPIDADLTASAKRVDDYTVVFTFKHGGKITGQTQVVVAKDGKTQTATQTGTNAQGQPIKNVTLFEKQ